MFTRDQFQTFQLGSIQTFDRIGFLFYIAPFYKLTCVKTQVERKEKKCVVMRGDTIAVQNQCKERQQD